MCNYHYKKHPYRIMPPCQIPSFQARRKQKQILQFTMCPPRQHPLYGDGGAGSKIHNERYNVCGAATRKSFDQNPLYHYPFATEDEQQAH